MGNILQFEVFSNAEAAKATENTGNNRRDKEETSNYPGYHTSVGGGGGYLVNYS